MQKEYSFGRWMKRLRVDRDWTQETLADHVGCATQTIRTLESGVRRPSRDLAERIADVLEIPAAERAEFIRLARQRQPSSLDSAPESPGSAHGTAKPVTPTPPSRRPRLPVLSNALIGRQREYTEVRDLLMQEDKRLVTLVGPGGAGKTSLALQLATDLQTQFVDGIAWVSLAAVAAPEHVVPALTEALGLEVAGPNAATEHLSAYLRNTQMLIVFDNFEHLLAAATLLGRILAEAPAVHLLATSRERLRLQAEWVVDLGGLPVPSTNDDEDVNRSEAVLLFLDRARRISSHFVLDRSNRVVVAQICRRLDGLPLAIELAASRVRLLPPHMLLQRLDHVLPLLSSGARDLPERQRTMRATIQWSYDLLLPEEQALFRRLAVFVDAWPLEAAEFVGVGPLAPREAVIELLASLQDKSLLAIQQVREDALRYRILEPVRQYGLEQLQAHGETHIIQQQYGQYYIQLAEQTQAALNGSQNGVWLQRLEDDLAHLRAVLAWSAAQPAAKWVTGQCS